MAFRELKGSGGGAFFKWEKVGTEFTGEFRGLGEGVFEGRATYHAVFIDSKGQTVKVNTPTILRDKLGEALPGEYIEMRYVGDKPRKGGKAAAKDFYVRVVEAPGSKAAENLTPQTGGDTIAEMRAKLEARIGGDAAAAMLVGINAKYSTVEEVQAALATLLTAHGIK